MTARAVAGVIVLSGDCPVEDAEVLVGLLARHPGLPVDVAGCGRVHTAVVQVLLAARPKLRGAPASFFGDWVVPLLLDAPAESNSTLEEASTDGSRDAAPPAHRYDPE